MTLSPEEFAAGWGADDLVRMARQATSGAIPDDARRFLIAAGLPALIRYSDGSNLAEVTFGRVARGPTPVLEEPISGGPLPASWSSFWIIGDEFFCNGSAWWCLDDRTGSVQRIDIELDEPIEFANSSVAHFAACVLAAVRSAGRQGRAEDWPARTASLSRELAEIDPAAMRSGRNFWPGCLDPAADARSYTFAKGTHSEGRRSPPGGFG